MVATPIGCGELVIRAAAPRGPSVFSRPTVIGDMVGPFRSMNARGSCGERSGVGREELIAVTYSSDTGHGPGGTEEVLSVLRRFAAFGDWWAPPAELACAVPAFAD